ncbi:MAG: tetratricopeptide repeat protein [Thermodesulfovibrionales bacterium]|nr:tetratricopeptide repeat protein [Thermodesulfovibrionales bacterium]
MGRFVLILFLFILIGLGYLATLNKETVTIAFTPEHVYETPKIVFMIVSGLAGAFLVLFIYTIRDTRRFIKNLREQKRQKKEERKNELYSKALDLILAGKKEEARHTLELIIKESPDFIHAYLRLSELCLEKNDLHKAYSYAEKARQLAPKRLDVLFNMATLMERAGRWQDALKYIEDILSLDRTNISALYRKRNVLEALQRWEELVDLERQIIRALPDERSRRQERRFLAGYKYELGRVSLERKDMERAKKSFKTAIKIDKFFIPAYLGLVEVMLSEGLTEGAIEFLWNSYEETSSPLLLARLEDLLITNGEPARLIRYYKGAIAKRPNDTLLNFLLGKLYYRLEMIDEAISLLRDMETGGETFPELHRLLGNLYLKRREPERAALEFRKAIDLRKTLRLNYCCNNCGYTADTWSGRCPNCKEWNSYTFNLEWFCRPLSEGSRRLEAQIASER